MRGCRRGLSPNGVVRLIVGLGGLIDRLVDRSAAALVAALAPACGPTDRLVRRARGCRRPGRRSGRRRIAAGAGSVALLQESLIHTHTISRIVLPESRRITHSCVGPEACARPGPHVPIAGPPGRGVARCLTREATSGELARVRRRADHACDLGRHYPCKTNSSSISISRSSASP
jgi:hypothetical protein